MCLSCFLGLRQRGVECTEGVGVLHGGPPPVGGRQLAAPSVVAKRKQTQAVEPLHQASSGPEHTGQPQTNHSAINSDMATSFEDKKKECA